MALWAFLMTLWAFLIFLGEISSAKYMKDENTAIAFGLNEVVLTLLCAFTGFLNKSRKEILYILAITAIASSIPDIYAFYSESQNEDKLSRGQAFKQSVPVFLAELLGAFALSLPLMIFTHKTVRIVATFVVGLSIIMANEILLQGNEPQRVAEVMVSVCLAVALSYVAAGLIRQLFKLF